LYQNGGCRALRLLPSSTHIWSERYVLKTASRDKCTKKHESCDCEAAQRISER